MENESNHWENNSGTADSASSADASASASAYAASADNAAACSESDTTSIPDPQPSRQSHKAAKAAKAASAGREPGRKRMNGSLKTFLVAFAGAACACLLVLGVYSLVKPGGTTVTIGGNGSGAEITVSGDDVTLPEVVAQKCLPSVAAIDVYTSTASAYGFSGYQSAGDLVESSLGSGVVLTEDGYIITNSHVVEGSEALMATVAGETYEAEFIGADSSSDVAVIKLKNASGLIPIEIGDSDELAVGEWVMTIGSPFGLEQSVATGIVSATSRSQVLSSETDGSTTIYPNMVQTDAAINPGNSGGAMVNKYGQLIGINTLITSYSGSYSGVGFAIPVNYAVSLATKIIGGENPTHAQLGVTMGTVTSQNARQYNLSVKSGAYVSGVMSGSGAEKAGIEVGDVIVSFDGGEITSASDLQLAVRSKNIGDTVKVKVNRGGKEIEMDVQLGSDESAGAVQNSGQNNNGSGNGYGYGYGYNGMDGLFDDFFGGPGFDF